MKNRVKWFMVSMFLVMLLAFVAGAQEEGGKELSKGDLAKAFGLLATGLGMAIATFGGALGQGKATSTALEGIARNPGAQEKMFVPLVLGLVLIESLVIYTLVVEIILIFTKL